MDYGGWHPGQSLGRADFFWRTGKNKCVRSQRGLITLSSPSSSSQQLTVPFNSVLVSNIPPWMTEDKLIIHFQRTSNGGGDVKNVTFTNPSMAVVTFNDPECACNVLRKTQMTENGEILKMELYKEVFGEVTAVLPHNVLQNLDSPLVDKIKKETGAHLKRERVNLSISGTWTQVEAARKILQLHLSPDVHLSHGQASVNGSAAIGAATNQPYNPDRYQGNSGDVERLTAGTSTHAGADTRGDIGGQGEDMEWEDETGASPSPTSNPCFRHLTQERSIP
ncbi:PREDICTED: uncharacterized protein LOC109486755 [Branchiostoma belcheri]|uniref:Uncharacterized protein LOC109486755 n=1 Tax=Branchiostoma belcheri TaxID=7741 RepID=A0A6P5AIU3_BRABE|nr:PREDICTED: uncharacterized protein LOC109486755 [Branchiostoma belcheri]